MPSGRPAIGALLLVAGLCALGVGVWTLWTAGFDPGRISRPTDEIARQSQEKLYSLDRMANTLRVRGEQWAVLAENRDPTGERRAEFERLRAEFEWLLREYEGVKERGEAEAVGAVARGRRDSLFFGLLFLWASAYLIGKGVRAWRTHAPAAGAGPPVTSAEAEPGAAPDRRGM